jgi:hypothetical protein
MSQTRAGAVEADAAKRRLALGDFESRDGHQHDEQFEDAGQDQRGTPAGRALHLEPADMIAARACTPSPRTSVFFTPWRRRTGSA